VLIARIGDDAYNVVLLLHILAAIVGFGGVFLNGIYGAEAKNRRGPEGLAVAKANFRVSWIAEWFIYAVPIFGFALIGMSDDVIEFGDTWIWLSILLYVVGLGVSHGVLMRNVKRMHVLMEELVGMGPPPAAAGAPAGGPPPQAAELEQRGKTVGMAGAFLNVLLVVMVYLMVFKPGA
jgi:uncharacterized membrane protein